MQNKQHFHARVPTSGLLFIAQQAMLVILVLGMSAQAALSQWQPHFVKQGDGAGGFVYRDAQIQILTKPATPPWTLGGNTINIIPDIGGMVQMSNGDIALTGRLLTSKGTDGVIAFSSDGGATWGAWQSMADGASLTTEVLAEYAPGTLRVGGSSRRLSTDFGQTWPVSTFSPPNASNGEPWRMSGNVAIDRDGFGNPTRIMEIAWTLDGGFPPANETIDFNGHFRYSLDSGATWQGEVEPAQWKRVELDEFSNPFTRGVSEGSVVRAANGDLVATLRTDMSPIYFNKPNNDSLEGVGVSISSDNGATWSNVNILYSAGRQQANIHKLPNGDLVMTIINRDDIRGSITGTSTDLTTNMRGADALISRDNGQTWNLNERFTLDAFEFLDSDPNQWFNGAVGNVSSDVLDDGTMLTAYGNYLIDNGQRAIVLVNWDPNAPTVSPVISWGGDASGNWNSNANWSTWLHPSDNVSTAVFGSAITSSRTVVANGAVTVKNVQFDNANTYAIAGGGSVNLEANMGSAGIDVLQGSHQFQAIVNLNSSTDVDVTTGASLAFNNALNLNGNNLTKTGVGTMAINNVLNTGGGSVLIAAGALGGSGEINGDVTNDSGTVAPGNSPGTLTVNGDYFQGAGATLAIEIAGKALHDLLDVSGIITLNGGSLDVLLLDGFNPAEGDIYDILDFSAIDGVGFDSLNLPALASGLIWDTSDLMTAGSLSVSSVPEPSALMLMGIAMFTLLGQGWRRFRS